MIDLTTLNRSGGCSCKLPPAQLERLLKAGPSIGPNTNLLEPDDASFAELASGEILVSSVDFQNPVVSDPFDSGQIGALNALSDIYACGASPMWAEVLLALPATNNKDQLFLGRSLMSGVRAACEKTNCSIVGGHTIVLPTPLIGLAVRGIAKPSHVKRKCGARPGDVVIVTKELGSGVAVSARQNGFLSDDSWDSAMKTMLTPNDVGAHLGQISAVTSLTDITGFGLLGHAVEVGRASNVCIEIDFEAIPILADIERAAQSGHSPQLAESNLIHVGPALVNGQSISDSQKLILADPQTNGGLLITVGPNQATDVLECCTTNKTKAKVVGRVIEASDGFFSLKQKEQS